MIRSLLLVFIGLLLHATEAALAVSFGSAGLPLSPGIVVVAYAALVEPPVEAAITAALMGVVMDAMLGAPVGLNMLACLFALGLGRTLADKVSSPRSLVAFLFAAGISAAYHTFVVTLLFVFTSAQAGRGVFSVLPTALANGALSFFLFPLLRRLLIAAGLEEREVSFEERLSDRATRKKPRQVFW